MARTNNLSNFLTDVADAIRTKKGSEELIAAEDFDTEIENLPSGGDLSEYYTSTISSGTTAAGGWKDTIKKMPAFTNDGTNCSYMFYDCTSTIIDLSNFNTSSVTNMEGMFRSCSKVEGLNLSTFNTQNVTNMKNIFSGCSKLQTITHNLNMSNVDNMEGMFGNCTSLREVDFSNVPSKTSINTMYGMFSGCTKIEIIDLSGFNINSISTLGYTFSNCRNLNKLDVRGIKFSSAGYNPGSMFQNVPANCEIIVKDDTQKNWVLTQRSDFTNVKTVAEYETEQNA